MRFFFCVLAVVNFTNLCVAGESEVADVSSHGPSAPEHVDIETLTGAELFDHQWSHYSAEQRKAVDKTKEVEYAADDKLAAEMALADRRAIAAAQSSADRRAAMARVRSRSQSPTAVVGSRTGDGLGPLHNAVSCAECHERGGAAGVEHNATLLTIDPRSFAVSAPTTHSGQQLFEVLPGLLNELGGLNIETVLHDRSAKAGYYEIRQRLVDYVPGGIADAWFDPAKRTSEAIAKQPVIAGRHGDVDFYLSQRNPPPLYGLGLIDKIKPKRLLALVARQAEEGRVSGRVAQKFGWRGQIASVDQFVSQACAGELGLTHPTAVQPGDPANPLYRPPGFDMSAASVQRLAHFVTLLPTPVEANPKKHSDGDSFEGESVFNRLGCADCHVADVYPAMNVFSDLLLHDMGERLQATSAAPVGTAKTSPMRAIRAYDVRGPISGAAPVYYGASSGQGIPGAESIARPAQPQFPRGEREIPTEVAKEPAMTWDDLQREWRTPPLWGVADTAPYLHDGRAKTLEEAILWHGGEAHDSKDLFVALNEKDKTNLMTFLSTLQAPKDEPIDEAKSGDYDVKEDAAEQRESLPFLSSAG